MHLSMSTTFRFNEEFNLFLAHAFMSGTGRTPWVECYLYNFNNALEWFWIYGTLVKPKKATKQYIAPEVGKLTGRLEMPISVTPRIPKNASCDICGTKKFNKSPSGKLYTLEYSLSQSEVFFPRKALMVHLPPEEEGKTLLNTTDKLIQTRDAIDREVSRRFYEKSRLIHNGLID